MKKRKIYFLFEGKVENEEQNFDISKLKPILGDLPNNVEVEKLTLTL